MLTATQVEGMTEATITFYRDNLRRMLRWWRIQDYPEDIADITADHIRALLKYVQTETNRFEVNPLPRAARPQWPLLMPTGNPSRTPSPEQ